MPQPEIVVSEVKVVLSHHPERGPLAFASCVLKGAVLLTNIAVFRDDDGGLHTRFPRKVSRGGREYYYFCPITREAKKVLDDAVLAFFRK